MDGICHPLETAHKAELEKRSELVNHRRSNS